MMKNKIVMYKKFEFGLGESDEESIRRRESSKSIIPNKTIAF